jgi:nucleoside-diphosphate-sugar epimerase
MTTAFIAGATGYTGREVTRALRARGIETVAHARPGSRALAKVEPLFRELGATLDDTPWEQVALTATLARLRPDVVFALLGTTKARGREAARRGEDPSAQTYEAVDYGLSAMLLRAVQAAALRPRFVYLSSTGVTDGSANPYLAVRARFERELRESGIPYTIARPCFITGPDREESRPLERLGALAADGALGVLGALGGKKLRDRYRSNDARTLGASLVRHAFESSSENAVLESESLRA